MSTIDSKFEFKEKLEELIKELIDNIKPYNDFVFYTGDEEIKEYIERELSKNVVFSPCIEKDKIFVIPVDSSKPIKIYFE